MFTPVKENQTLETILERSAEELNKTELPLMEDFYTIQGEGAHTGRPAYFIRTAGCDVNCWWCDVQESWDESKHPAVEVGEIVQR
ncbi:MAG TPA: 7-carboxy-7-deazaguanine synthase QueE, partial [Halalkalibaculum sp.]|nr:7-carboxy-7-deazaguanine synthase QueE [Halalkalibaculum sp.]